MLNKEILSQLLPEVNVSVYDVTDSTNIRATELSQTVLGNILVACEEQTQGQGRQGKSFYSPAESGVYFSAVIRTKHQLGNVVCVTSAAAVAVAKVIEELTDLDPKIKWVNDIYIDEKKVCGIIVRSLIKNGRLDGLLFGIGVNVSTQNFPDEISSRAGSLGREIDRNIFIAKVIKKLIDFSKNPENKAYLDYYKKKSCVIGRKIKFYENNIEHFAKAIDIDENANLIVSENGEIKKLSSGEITLRLN